jgi:hypothetical protein
MSGKRLSVLVVTALLPLAAGLSWQACTGDGGGPPGAGDGQACTASEDCATGYCVQLVCDANACTRSEECGSGNFCDLQSGPSGQCADENDCRDDDNDGSGVGAACSSPTQDCDDNDADRSPIKQEQCGGDGTGDSKDNDCDGETDEGCAACAQGATRPCSTACGEGEETCLQGTYRNCDARLPQDETCNGLDDDCDGHTDEDVGCGGEGEGEGEGEGPPECEESNEGVESCDDIDNDCDGDTDEELVRACENECGAGEENCAQGAWVGCTAREPDPLEVCRNDIDDNCDGEVDEGCEDECQFVPEICGDGVDQDCNGEDALPTPAQRRQIDPAEPNDDCTCREGVNYLGEEPGEDAPVESQGVLFVGDDNDYYCFDAVDNFNLIPNERITAELTFVPPNTNYDLYLYRNEEDCRSNTVLAASENRGQGEPEALVWGERAILGDSGRYFVRVRRRGGFDCTNPYVLEVSGLH